MQCCGSGGVYGGPINCTYGAADMNCTLSHNFHQTALRDMDYTWFWEGNVTWKGYIGLKGTIVVKGDMTIEGDKDDRYCKNSDTTGTGTCTVNVPPLAWKEYMAFDSGTTNQYPGDLGLSSSTIRYLIGTNATENAGSGGDLGVYGFLYVKGNFTRNGASDIYGSMWVEGAVTGTGNTMVFFNSKLNVPTLNVVLVRDSWKETKANILPWPAP